MPPKYFQRKKNFFFLFVCADTLIVYIESKITKNFSSYLILGDFSSLKKHGLQLNSQYIYIYIFFYRFFFLLYLATQYFYDT